MSKTPKMMHITSRNTQDDDVVGSILVEPGKFSSLFVGIFEDGIPEPDLALEVEPKNCTIRSRLVRAKEGGEYRLIYHFMAPQNVPCQVTVRQLQLA
jgi:hypothetical protein